MAEPWSAEALGEDKFRFTNTSGETLAMIVLAPRGGATVKVIDGTPLDPHTVPAPVKAGDNFVALVRGAGVRITATFPTNMQHTYWEFNPA